MLLNVIVLCEKVLKSVCDWMEHSKRANTNANRPRPRKEVDEVGFFLLERDEGFEWKPNTKSFRVGAVVFVF